MHCFLIFQKKYSNISLNKKTINDLWARDNSRFNKIPFVHIWLSHVATQLKPKSAGDFGKNLENKFISKYIFKS